MKYKISSIASIISGGTPKKNIPEYWNGTIPWITIKDFNSKYVSSVTNYISKKGLDNSSVNLTRNNDILISARGTVGKLLMVESGMTFNQSIYCIRPNEQLVIPDYLYYWLCKNIEKIKKGVHGSVFDTITRKTFDLIEINLPSLQLQKEISKKVKVLDDKIELNRRINANLDELKTAYFDKLFKQKMQSNLNGKLKNITQIKSGKRPERKSNTQSSFDKYPIVGASKVMGYTDKYLYNKTILTTGRVGTHGVVQRFREPVWVSDNSFVFETEHEDYLFEVLKHWVNYNAINRGSTQPLITQTDLKNINIYVPAKYEFNNFENVTNKLTNLQFNLIKQNQKLNEIKKSLLNSLFL